MRELVVFNIINRSPSDTNPIFCNFFMLVEFMYYKIQTIFIYLKITINLNFNLFYIIYWNLDIL